MKRNKTNKDNIVDFKNFKKNKPTETDAFTASIEEEIRAENLKIFWKKYGKILTAAFGILIAAGGIYNMWQKNDKTEREAISYKFTIIQNMVLQNKNAEAISMIKDLTNVSKKEYATLAKLEYAAILINEKNKEAIDTYKSIADDEKSGEMFRDLAYIFYVNASLSLIEKPLNLDEMISTLSGDKFQNGCWHILAKESLAFCYIKADKKDLAKSTLEKLVKTEGIPNNIAERSRILIQSLG